MPNTKYRALKQNYSPNKMDTKYNLLPIQLCSSFVLKKKLLTTLIFLDIVSWIVFDLFLHFYIDHLLLDKLGYKLHTDEYAELRRAAFRLFLTSSLIGLIVQATGLVGSLSENVCLLSAYVLSMILGSSVMLLMVLGLGLSAWLWTMNAVWSCTLTGLSYAVLRDILQARHREEIERLSGGDFKV